MQKKGSKRSPNDGANSARSSLHKALDTPYGRKLPEMMRRIAIRFASGEALEHIADVEAMTVVTVEDLLRYTARTLGCKPLPLGMAKAEKTTAERGPDGTKELNAAQFLTEEKCEGCGKVIEADSERIVLAPMELQYYQEFEDWGDHKIKPRFSQEPHHYCLDCARSTEEFRIPNPWFRNEQEREEWAKVMVELKAQQALERDERDKVVANALARGKTGEFNRAFPTRPEQDDVLARATPESRIAARIAARESGNAMGSGESTPTNEIVDNLMAARPEWEIPIASEEDRRARVGAYIACPASRGLPHNMKKAAKLWAEGISQGEIADKLRIHKSSVSRMIQTVVNKANASR
jgi:hypothetical protein